MSNFILRTLTGFAVVLLVSILWVFLPVKGMFLLVSAVTAGLIWEYYKLVFYQILYLRFRIFFLVFCFLSYLFIVIFKIASTEAFLYVVALFFVSCFWILYPLKKQTILKGLSYGLLSLFYIVFPAALFLKLFLYQEQTRMFLLLFLSIIFAGDISAYLGGSLIGGKKWVSLLSPKKTWSGLLCGLLISAVVSGLGFYLTVEFNIYIFFIFGAVSFFIAQTGDLFVSLLKRLAHVKDSGTSLPGHGGFLDRLDGFLLAFPFMYFFVFKVYY